MTARRPQLPERPSCPFCEGTDTELMNAFGGHASVSTYWCRRCASPFDFLRWAGTEAGEGAGKEAGEGAGTEAGKEAGTEPGERGHG